MKRIAGILFGVWVILFLMTPVPASAASAWYDCSIDSVGIAPSDSAQISGYYVFVLTDTAGSFADLSFRVERVDANNPLLSIFLTAAGSGLPVKVFLDPADPDSMVEAHVVRP